MATSTLRGHLLALVTFAWPALPAIGQTWYGPSSYLEKSDSPVDLSGLGDTFFLEDMEDGKFNTPGIKSYNGTVVGPGGNTDSVDEDDGNIDGSGTKGHSLFLGNGATGITIGFDTSAFGALPTHVGIVWTDGGSKRHVILEAFDADGASIGTVEGYDIGDGSNSVTTAEDRFFGVVYDAGVSKIHIYHGNSGGGIEVDHVQYGIESNVRGDMNCDGLVDFNDIDPFVVALTGEDNYAQQYPDCVYANGDIDCNGSVDFDDIDGFVDCVINEARDDCP